MCVRGYIIRYNSIQFEQVSSLVSRECFVPTNCGLVVWFFNHQKSMNIVHSTVQVLKNCVGKRRKCLVVNGDDSTG